MALISSASGKSTSSVSRSEPRKISIFHFLVLVSDSGSGIEAVVKTTVFLKDMADFPKMNAVYAEFFPQNPPARSTVQAALPKGGSVEIEAIALVK